MEIVDSDEEKIVGRQPASYDDLHEEFPETPISPDELTEDEKRVLAITTTLVTSRIPVKLITITGTVREKAQIKRYVTTRMLIRAWQAGLVRRFYRLRRQYDQPRSRGYYHYLLHNLDGFTVPKPDPMEKLTRRERAYYPGYHYRTLSDNDVRAIRESDEDIMTLVRRYGVTDNHIYRIKQGKARKNIR